MARIVYISLNVPCWGDLGEYLRELQMAIKVGHERLRFRTWHVYIKKQPRSAAPCHKYRWHPLSNMAVSHGSLMFEMVGVLPMLSLYMRQSKFHVFVSTVIVALKRYQIFLPHYRVVKRVNMGLSLDIFYIYLFSFPLAGDGCILHFPQHDTHVVSTFTPSCCTMYHNTSMPSWTHSIYWSHHVFISLTATLKQAHKIHFGESHLNVLCLKFVDQEILRTSNTRENPFIRMCVVLFLVSDLEFSQSSMYHDFSWFMIQNFGGPSPYPWPSRMPLTCRTTKLQKHINTMLWCLTRARLVHEVSKSHKVVVLSATIRSLSDHGQLERTLVTFTT